MIKPIEFLVIATLFFFSSNSVVAQSITFSNPLLTDFYSDPSVLKVGTDYYLINSTFSYFPGIPVFHSKDLKNWEQVGNVMSRPSQMNFMGHRMTRGLFAPAIDYHNGTYYVTCTLIDKGGNFIVKAKNPAGPWSDPTFLPELRGIDWILLKDNVVGKFLSTEVAGGFIGCVFGMYATSSGKPTTNSASFKYLIYTGNDPMYENKN